MLLLPQLQLQYVSFGDLILLKGFVASNPELANSNSFRSLWVAQIIEANHVYMYVSELWSACYAAYTTEFTFLCNEGPVLQTPPILG